MISTCVSVAARGGGEMDDRLEQLSSLRALGLTPRAARAVMNTLRDIREDGFLSVKRSMPASTLGTHLRHLRAIGVDTSSLPTMPSARVIPLRRAIEAVPVSSWEELRELGMGGWT